MAQQVITIGVHGQISGLQRKPGQGVDLRKFGPAKIVRASEIVPTEDGQAWSVDVLQEAGKGLLTANRWIAEVTATMWPEGLVSAPVMPSDVLLFADYDKAVAAEIAYLDALRLRGAH